MIVTQDPAPARTPPVMPTVAETKRPTFAIYTLGCKVNQYDSNRISAVMTSRGFEQVPFHQVADAYIIDTCTVTHQADQKSRKAISRAIRSNPHAVIAVTGCAAAWAGDQFRRMREDAIVTGMLNFNKKYGQGLLFH